MEFQRELHAEFEKRNLADKERWRSESNKQAELERKLALEQQKTLLLQNKRKLKSCISKKIRLCLKIVLDRPRKTVCHRTPQILTAAPILRRREQNRLELAPARRRHNTLLPLLRGRLRSLLPHRLIILRVCLLCLPLRMIVVLCCRCFTAIPCRLCRLCVRLCMRNVR